MNHPLRLIFAVHRTTHRVGLYIQARTPDLNQAEAHILCHLAEFGDAAIAELHRAFAHKRSTLTSVLDRLAARGLVRRESSLEDRRSFIVRLTRSGKRKALKIHRELERLEAAALRGTARAEMRVFEDLLGRLERSATNEAVH